MVTVNTNNGLLDAQRDRLNAFAKKVGQNPEHFLDVSKKMIKRAGDAGLNTVGHTIATGVDVVNAGLWTVDGAYELVQAGGHTTLGTVFGAAGTVLGIGEIALSVAEGAGHYTAKGFAYLWNFLANLATKLGGGNKTKVVKTGFGQDEDSVAVKVFNAAGKQFNKAGEDLTDSIQSFGIASGFVALSVVDACSAIYHAAETAVATAFAAGAAGIGAGCGVVYVAAKIAEFGVDMADKSAEISAASFRILAKLNAKVANALADSGNSTIAIKKAVAEAEASFAALKAA